MDAVRQHVQFLRQDGGEAMLHRVCVSGWHEGDGVFHNRVARRIDESRRRNTVETFTERIRHEVHLPWLRGTHIDGANGCSLCRSRINETPTARRGLAREGDRLRKAKPMPGCGKRLNALWGR